MKTKLMLRELAMRGNFALPENEQDLEWFDAGMKDSGDFMIRLFKELRLGKGVSNN